MIEVDALNSSGQNSAVSWYFRLWAAAIRRAAVDYALYKDHEDIKLKKLGMEAHKWIFCAPENPTEINAFPLICDMLGIPVSIVRKHILDLTEDEARRLRGMEFGDSIG